MSGQHWDCDENGTGIPRDIEEFLYARGHGEMIDRRWATKTGGFFYPSDPSLRSVISIPSATSEDSSISPKEPCSRIQVEKDGIINAKERSLLVARAVSKLDGEMKIPRAIEMEEPTNYSGKKYIWDEILLCPLQRFMNLQTFLGACGVFLVVLLIVTSRNHVRSKRLNDSAYQKVRDRIEGMIDVRIDKGGPLDQALEWISSDDYIYRKVQLKDPELIQRLGIAATYFATSESTWKRCGYRSRLCDKPMARWLGPYHECFWEGVSCDYFDRVTDISLDDNGVNGEFPTAISLLPELTSLDLQKGQIRGVLPNLAAFSRLRTLILGKNSLSGELPPTLTQSTVLEELNISFNNIRGTITKSFFKSKRLRRLNLQGNTFQGPLQELIQGLPRSIKELTLEDNRLSGSIPPKLERFTNLELLSLDRNALTGTMPSELRVLSNLSHLSVGEAFTTPQDFPEAVYDLPKLEYFNAEGCGLKGRLKDEGVAKWSVMRVLDLSRNELTGTIPAVLANVSSALEGVDLSWNLLSGTVPPELCDLDFHVDCFTERIVCQCCKSCCQPGDESCKLKRDDGNI